MSENEAWELLEYFADQGGLVVDRTMTIGLLRRTFAKAFHPRKADDDDSIIRKIHPALDVIRAARDLRELTGQAAPDDPAARESAAPRQKPGRPPWHPDPDESTTIERNDFHDLNYIRKTVYENSLRFGGVELVKLWSWEPRGFRRLISAYANEYAYETLARALVVHLTGLAADPQQPVTDAIFLTHGSGRVGSFRLILIRIGRSFEDVSRYDLQFDGYADDPRLLDFVPAWLKLIGVQLRRDMSPRR